MGASDNFVINCWRCVVFGKADKVFFRELCVFRLFYINNYFLAGGSGKGIGDVSLGPLGSVL